MKGLTQVKALIRNLSKQKDVNAQVLLRNYMLERLLERIAISEYQHNFILKGGMLVAALVGVDLRSTIDMDTTIKSLSLSRDSIEKIILEITTQPLEDGVTFSINSIEEIREGESYLGYRVSLIAELEEAKVPLKLDITTGDQITPKEIAYKFDLMFENRTIEVFAYPLETVLAEKFETILIRGTANTRMRDYYDIHILLKLKGHLISKEELAKAVLNTAEQRGTLERVKESEETLLEIEQDANLQNYWKNYQKKNKYVGELEWNQILESVNRLYTMIFDD